jgi:hypothetical protein
MRILLAAAAIALVAAAPAADPLQSKLIADAKLFPPSTLSFTRNVTMTQTGDGKTEKSVRVDRWDGKQWTLVSVDGKPPSADEAAKFRKETAGRPVPGYYRLAGYLNAPASRGTDAQGNTVLKIAKLPSGSVDMAGDRSDKFGGEAVVATAGPTTYVKQLRVSAREPFRLMVVAKIDRFDIVNDYALGKAGRPVVVRSVQEYAGSRPGESGTVRNEVVYSYDG